MDIKMMSNAELKIHLKEIEFEYEALQTKMQQDFRKLKELNEKYLKVKEIINKRTKGWV